MRQRAQGSDRLHPLLLGRALTAAPERGMQIVRFVLRPFGYLAFVLALLALSAAAKLLGEDHELGFFSERLGRTLWRYPEITRPGVQTAWLVWVVLFGIALSPVDPVSTPWDEAVLAAVALGVLWHRIYGEHRAER